MDFFSFAKIDELKLLVVLNLYVFNEIVNRFFFEVGKEGVYILKFGEFKRRN